MKDRIEETLSALIEQREKIYYLSQIRKTMGGFDANADAIMAVLAAISAILDHQITLAEQDKRRK